MHRLIPTVGKGAEVVAAAVTSIVLTVLALTRGILAVHADQTEWAETTVTSTPAPAADGGHENGGESAWV
ncbi:hypothetical protein [Haloplanus aerogenes]|nr:hypothetical protein [Haloplanus aerogenes]AZH25035.1 hypothetical protein DU502_06455 [Haloplanus aerogenes]